MKQEIPILIYLNLYPIFDIHGICNFLNPANNENLHKCPREVSERPNERANSEWMSRAASQKTFNEIIVIRAALQH